MPLPFDATLKDLVQAFLPDYTEQLGLRDFAPLVPLNVDLSTITAATDIALGRGDPPDPIVDLNFQSGPDEDLAPRVLLYNTLLHYRFRVPVHSVLVLLRPVADHVQLTGKLRYGGPARRGRMDFTYRVVRLWQQPVRRYLRGGLGTLPLAPLCRLPPGVPAVEALAPIIEQIGQRLAQEARPEDRAKLLTATYILTGLRLPRDTTRALFEGVQTMIESSTYQGIIEEGECRALQKVLLRQGTRRFGTAGPEVQAELRGITDLGRLERMTDQLFEVTTWKDLLATH